MTRPGEPIESPELPLPDPALRDGEIELRAWSPPDAADLAAAWADPEIVRWTGVPKRHDERAAILWIAGERARRTRGLAIDLVVDLSGSVAGEVGLVRAEPGPGLVEVGWWTASRFRGQGVAKRAVGLLTRWAISDLGMAAAVARCHPANPGSIAVARAAGFTCLGSEGGFEVWVLRR